MTWDTTASDIDYDPRSVYGAALYHYDANPIYRLPMCLDYTLQSGAGEVSAFPRTSVGQQRTFAVHDAAGEANVFSRNVGNDALDHAATGIVRLQS